MDSETTMLVGKAPLTQARTATGRIVFVRAGAPAPSDLVPADRDRLIADGYLVEVPVAVEVVVEVVEPVTPPVTPAAVTEPVAEPVVAEPVTEPVVEAETPVESASGRSRRRGAAS